LLEDPTHDPNVDWPRPVADWMRTDPLTVAHDSMALAAKELMQENSVLTLVVTDSDNRVCGAVQLYDILRAGI
jgi:arabinose-5-phosphate isomerase